MTLKVQKQLNNRFPKNFILKKPLVGTLILLGFQYLFLVLYRPLNVHGAKSFSIELTMFIYILIQFIPVYGCLLILKRLPFFSRETEWTLMKELHSAMIMLFRYGLKGRR
jgi:hypothetical protein